MSFSNYTTRELEFIISNFDDLKRELEERNIKESNSFPFKIDDIIYSKYDDDNFLLKIKNIDKENNSIIVDEIIIKDGGSFNYYVDVWFNIARINCTEWHEYVKIEDSEIFENLLNIIDKYNDEVQQLNDDAYLKLKNEITPYDYNV